jgi:hypothetical protein
MLNFLDPKNNPWIQAMPYMPGFDVFDQFMCYWYDIHIDALLKIYFWPAFVAGSADNVMDLFKPETYSICKV